MKKLAMAVKVYLFCLIQYNRIYLLHFQYALFFSQLMGSQGEDGASDSKNMMSSSFKEKNAIRDKMKKDKTKKPTDEETLRQQKKLEFEDVRQSSVHNILLILSRTTYK